MPNLPPHTIEILAFADVQVLDVTGPAQVFASANDLSPDGVAKPYTISIVAETPEVRTSAGIRMQTEALSDGEPGPGTLMVAGGSGVDAAARNTGLLAWIKRRSAQASRTASVCSGAILLAEAGLIDGRRVVTHWGRCSAFARCYPSVRLDPDPIFVRDGPFWTSAGITAGIDLALAMVEADHGRPLALAVARQLVMFLKRPGGQAQFSAVLAMQSADSRFDRLHGWIAANLDRDLSLDALARQAGMSLRSFARHYGQRIGRTPGEAVELMRVEGARRCLEEGTTVTVATRRCGFGSTETMRRAFMRHVGVTPRDYRDRFHR